MQKVCRRLRFEFGSQPRVFHLYHLGFLPSRAGWFCAQLARYDKEFWGMNKKLYVGNLPYSVTDVELRELFAQAGEVTDAAVIMDRETGRSKGFGFVEMNTDDEATKTITQFNGHTLSNRQIQLSEARPREERGPRTGGGGRSGGYSDRGDRGGGYGGDRDSYGGGGGGRRDRF